MAAAEFDRGGLNDLIHRRLGCAVADPTTQPVAPDRTNPRRKRRKDAAPVARQKTRSIS
jgi:hypothetical protein